MQYILMAIGSLLITIWCGSLLIATKSHMKLLVLGKILSTKIKIENLIAKRNANTEKLSGLRGIEKAIFKLVIGDNYKKEILKCQEQIKSVKSGSLNQVGFFALPGLILDEKIPVKVFSSLKLNLLKNVSELYGREFSAERTKLYFAQMLSLAVLGLGVSLVLGGVLLITAPLTTGLIVTLIGIVLTLVLSYTTYDEILSQANKRKKMITRHFANVVSKLAILANSGMIMDTAWRQTAYSQNYDIYLEMQKTVVELDNAISPVVAYGNFINRCNTKETTKLASAIIQNLSKGNEEIANVLMEMSKVAWHERKNLAKRDSEASNSKLMIPTMLLFLAILIMIMVPIITNFSAI